MMMMIDDDDDDDDDDGIPTTVVEGSVVAKGSLHIFPVKISSLQKKTCP